MMAIHLVMLWLSRGRLEYLQMASFADKRGDTCEQLCSLRM